MASHYYAEMIFPDGSKERCEYVMDEAQAARFSTPDFEYPEGTPSERYETRADAIKAALSKFQESATGPTLLILGQSWYEPALVLDAVDVEPWRVAVLNDLYSQAIGGGWYEGRNGDHLMKTLSEAYADQLETVGLELNDDRTRP